MANISNNDYWRFEDYGRHRWITYNKDENGTKLSEASYYVSGSFDQRVLRLYDGTTKMMKDEISPVDMRLYSHGSPGFPEHGALIFSSSSNRLTVVTRGNLTYGSNYTISSSEGLAPISMTTSMDCWIQNHLETTTTSTTTAWACTGVYPANEENSTTVEIGNGVSLSLNTAVNTTIYPNSATAMGKKVVSFPV